VSRVQEGCAGFRKDAQGSGRMRRAKEGCAGLRKGMARRVEGSGGLQSAGREEENDIPVGLSILLVVRIFPNQDTIHELKSQNWDQALRLFLWSKEYDKSDIPFSPFEVILKSKTCHPYKMSLAHPLLCFSSRHFTGRIRTHCRICAGTPLQ
jgi:hypothetical protein